jgi:hypothetical protein
MGQVWHVLLLHRGCGARHRIGGNVCFSLVQWRAPLPIACWNGPCAVGRTWIRSNWIGLLWWGDYETCTGRQLRPAGHWCDVVGVQREKPISLSSGLLVWWLVVWRGSIPTVLDIGSWVLHMCFGSCSGFLWLCSMEPGSALYSMFNVATLITIVVGPA